MILEIILGITTITFGYTSFNLFRKVERLEDWVEDYSQRIVDADTTLKQLDSEGKFESDDEINSFALATSSGTSSMEIILRSLNLKNKPQYSEFKKSQSAIYLVLLFT